VKRTAAEVQSLGDVLPKASVPARVALLFSYDSDWALQIQPGHPQLDYITQNLSYYAPFYEANIGVDIVAPDADLSKYRVVLAPALHLLSDDLAGRLEAYVEAGGLLIAGFRSGVKTVENKVTRQTLPGLLADILGIHVVEYDPLYDQPQQVRFVSQELGSEVECEIWADIIELTTAKALATYTKDYYASSPAVTINLHGKGGAVYIGTGLKKEGLAQLLMVLASQQGVRPLMSTPPGVEVTRRLDENEQWWFILNHTGESQTVVLPTLFLDALKGVRASSPLTLEPYDVKVLKLVKKKFTATLK
jgi:beta-galactosidase